MAMSDAEFTQVWAAMCAAWASNGAPAGEIAMRAKALYQRALSDLSYEQTLDAVMACVAEERRWPSVAAIRKRIATLEVDHLPGELAYEELLKAVGRYGINGSPSFTNPCMKAAVANVGWRQICNSEERCGVTRAHFIKAYNAELERRRRKPQSDRIVAQLRTARAERQIGIGEAIGARLTLIEGGE